MDRGPRCPLWGRTAIGVLLAGAVLAVVFGRPHRGQVVSWGELDRNRRTYLRDLDSQRNQIRDAGAGAPVAAGRLSAQTTEGV